MKTDLYDTPETLETIIKLSLTKNDLRAFQNSAAQIAVHKIADAITERIMKEIEPVLSKIKLKDLTGSDPQ
jgi:hypothetical protein